MSDLRRVANRTVRLAQLGRTLRDDTILGSETGSGGAHLQTLTGAQSALHANSTSPSAISLSNTTVQSGYTTLGGRFLFNSAVGAATDYIIFQHTVPAGLRLLLEEIAINAVITVALTTTASILDWFLALGNAASLADASQRRIPLGICGFAASAAAGAMSSPPEIYRRFPSGLLVPAGKILTLGVQQPIGAATGTIRGDAFFAGLYEKV